MYFIFPKSKIAVHILCKPGICSQCQIKISISIIQYVELDSGGGSVGWFPTRVIRTFPITPERRQVQKLNLSRRHQFIYVDKTDELYSLKKVDLINKLI